MKKSFILIISILLILSIRNQYTNAWEILWEIPLWWSSKIINYSWEIKVHEFKNEKINKVYKLIKNYNENIKNSESLSVSEKSKITDIFNSIIDNFISFENWNYNEKEIALSDLKINIIKLDDSIKDNKIVSKDKVKINK